MRSPTYLCLVALLLPCACKGDPDEPSASDDSGSESTSETPGDGDPGDGDGDSCEIATEGCACTEGGSCDPGLICDNGICSACEVATEGCACTEGGSCNPGLICDGGVCVPESGDGDGDPGDGDGDPGDGDGDPGDGDGDPDPPDPPDPTEFVDLGDFMIGTTEVRVQEYGTFLVANVGFGMLPPECAWKTDYTPDQWNGQVQTGAEYPVRRVDWCDAWAYCWWAGGHLCGSIGGGAATLADANEASVSEWYHACTDDGATTYPYGDVYEPDSCNGADAGLGALQPAGTMLACEGGVPGLFDMSGNIWEWTNACATDNVADELQQCRRRGGSYVSDANLVRCAVGSLRERNFRDAITGIRCCADSP